MMMSWYKILKPLYDFIILKFDYIINDSNNNFKINANNDYLTFKLLRTTFEEVHVRLNSKIERWYQKLRWKDCYQKFYISKTIILDISYTLRRIDN